MWKSHDEGLAMKNKLTFALLFAGLFLSVKSYAAGECLGYSGSIVQAIEFPSSTCPTISAKTHGSVECELVQAGDWVCVEVTSGGSIGGPWRYTGNLFGGDTPDPEDPQDPSGIKYPESTFVPFESSANAVTASNNAGSAISDFSQKMAVSLNTLATNQSVLRSEAQDNKHQILSVMGQYNDQSFNRDVHLRDTVLSLNQQVISSFDAVEQSLDEKFTENKELHEKTHESQTAAQESLDDLGENLNQAAIGIENARYHAQSAVNAAESANYNSLQAFYAAQNAEQASYETYELAYESREDIREIYNRTYDNIETLSSIQSATSELFGLRDQIRSDTRASAQDAAFSTQDTVWQSNDQIMSYMGSLNQSQATALSDIKSAIQDIDSGTGGGSTDDTGTHERLDTLNAKTSELNQNVVDSALNTQQAISGSTDELLAELTAIKDALENGSSEYDDTEVNQKLTELINNTGTTGTNVVTSGQATQQAVSASGQQVTESVNGLGDKLDGIGEGIDSLSDSLKPGTGQKAGPTLCTGDDCYKGKSWVTPKYPEGISSIYEDHKTKFQDSSIHEYMKGFVPDLSGSAPDHWEFCINFDGMANLGCHTVELPPYVISFVRLIILISAGFLCRRLIFGG